MAPDLKMKQIGHLDFISADTDISICMNLEPNILNIKKKKKKNGSANPWQWRKAIGDESSLFRRNSK